MKRMLGLAIVVFMAVTHNVMAVDDGQTRPKANYASTNSWSTYVDLVPTTNGSGNVKGIQCVTDPALPSVVVFYVDGGAAQTVTLEAMVPLDSAATTHYTGWVPFNIRFASSIRIQIRKGSVITGSISCGASWALD